MSCVKKDTGASFIRAFSLATVNASADMSQASIVACGSCLLSAMAMQPLPVPRSSMRGCCVACSQTIQSTSSAVSGRGMSTDEFTANSIPQNGAFPSMYCSGSPCRRRSMMPCRSVPCSVVSVTSSLR